MGDDILILKISFTKIFNRFVFVGILYIWSMIRSDPFGNKLFLKRMLVTTIGWLTWARYARRNKIQISGTENLKHLANTNVLFVSNHQTYFAEVIAMLHVFVLSNMAMRIQLIDHGIYFVHVSILIL